MLLPLSHEIVGTDPSHGDNEGACCGLRGGGWETKTRETKKRDVESCRKHGDLMFGGGGSESLYVVRIPRARCGRAMTPRYPGTRLYLFPTTSESQLVPKGYVPGSLPNWSWVVPTRHLDGKDEPGNETRNWENCDYKIERA